MIGLTHKQANANWKAHLIIRSNNCRVLQKCSPKQDYSVHSTKADRKSLGENAIIVTADGIGKLRGIDDRFVYELNRNPSDIDEDNFTIEDVINDVDGVLNHHINVIHRAESLNIGYRRWAR